MSTQRETRDFMTVDAFSQLPFIRTSPVKPEKSCGNAAIRLFGIDVPHETPVAVPDSTSSSGYKESKLEIGKDAAETQSNASGGEANRKFECHYCCRNFPTSQALGGHQNAHKRERQHAKRVHLQSAMAAAHHQSLADTAHVYSLLNYHRLGSIPSPMRFARAYDPLPSYPSWSPAASSPRFYTGSIGGGLPPLWQLPPPPASMPLPLIVGEHGPRLAYEVGSTPSNASSSSSLRTLADNVGATDQQLSLDLHL